MSPVTGRDGKKGPKKGKCEKDSKEEKKDNNWGGGEGKGRKGWSKTERKKLQLKGNRWKRKKRNQGENCTGHQARIQKESGGGGEKNSPRIKRHPRGCCKGEAAKVGVANETLDVAECEGKLRRTRHST